MKRTEVIYFKDVVILLLCVLANTFTNHFLIDISTPELIEINGSIFSYIFVFLIPLIEHFSDLCPNLQHRAEKCQYLQKTHRDSPEECI